MPKFPQITPRDIDTDHMVCGDCILNTEKMTFNCRGQKDYPIEKCNGYIALSPRDVVKLREYGIKVKQYFENHCK